MTQYIYNQSNHEILACWERAGLLQTAEFALRPGVETTRREAAQIARSMTEASKIMWRMYELGLLDAGAGHVKPALCLDGSAEPPAALMRELQEIEVLCGPDTGMLLEIVDILYLDVVATEQATAGIYEGRGEQARGLSRMAATDGELEQANDALCALFGTMEAEDLETAIVYAVAVAAAHWLQVLCAELGAGLGLGHGAVLATAQREYGSPAGVGLMVLELVQLGSVHDALLCLTNCADPSMARIRPDAGMLGIQAALEHHWSQAARAAGITDYDGVMGIDPARPVASLATSLVHTVGGLFFLYEELVTCVPEEHELEAIYASKDPGDAGETWWLTRRRERLAAGLHDTVRSLLVPVMV